MSACIGIIGMGWVGSSVAVSTLQRGLAADLLLNDVRSEIAEGEAMDLEHGSLFYPVDARVRATSVEEIARSADAVVLAAGRGGGPDESRLALLRDNAALARDIGGRLAGFEGVVLVVTNPVDVLTQIVADASGLPVERVIGTGTLLDTARLRYELAEELGLHPASIHAQVVGEHGDSEVCLWSTATIAGVGLRDWPGWSGAKEDSIAKRVRRAAYEIIQRKGATNHAIGMVTATLLAALLKNERRAYTVSTVQDGPYGLERVALSLPSVLGAGGVLKVLEPALDTAERAGLVRSAQTIRGALTDAG
jgi:L-lactate dehydrogenase